MHTAIYDAWAAYDPVAVDTRQRLRATPELRQPATERTQDNKEKAVSFAAYAALVDLFPARQSIFRDYMERPVADGGLGYQVDGSDTSTAATVGTLAAKAVLDYRHNDGSNQLNGYADPCEPACYQPVNTWDKIRTPTAGSRCVCPPHPRGDRVHRGSQRFLTPHWRNVTPFALTSASQFRSPGPAISSPRMASPTASTRTRSTR